MKTVAITGFRKNLFQLVDETLMTGEPLAINRKGRRVVLHCAPAEKSETHSERVRRYFARSPSPQWAGFDLSLKALGGVEGGDHWE